MEEGLMAANLYPGVAAHVAQHREFQRRFKVIEEHAAARGPTASAILEVKDLIRGWFVSHIRTVDVQVAAYLSSLPGRADPRPPPSGGPGGAQNSARAATRPPR
jgi:hemerythrin